MTIRTHANRIKIERALEVCGDHVWPEDESFLGFIARLSGLPATAELDDFIDEVCQALWDEGQARLASTM